jgi:hypothetical protein
MSRAISSSVRALLVLLLVAASAAGAEARPHRTRVAQAETGADATDEARAQVKTTEKRRLKLATARADVSVRYTKELAAIAKLKRQKSSWRRDRQLKQKLKASLETAKKLAKQAKELTAIDVALGRQRKALVAAIDAELAGSPSASRAKSLRALRAEVAPKTRKKAHKIVLPDDELDPLADPDELDQQVAALRASEDELTRQIASLDRQASRFKKQAALRKAHDRADEMASRDDDQPRRTSGSGGTQGTLSDEGAGAPETDSDSPPSSDPAGSFDGDPAVVLSDVVDGDTVDALRKAERSTDPATKAAAAERAREQVARRLDKLEKRRKEIEARARLLRE